MNPILAKQYIFTAGFIVACCLVQVSQQLAATSGQLQAAKKSQCGTQHDLAYRVEICSRPVMDIIEGTLTKWPRNESDTESLCLQIHGAERCIRDEGRRCAQGLHKTIISTLANSVQGARKRECSKPKYPEILKTVQCIEKNNQYTRKLVADVIQKALIIEHQMKDLDQKTNAVCCLVKEMENEIRAVFNKLCPAQTETMLRLYNAVLNDVFNLICRSSKCSQDIFKGYKIQKATDASQAKLVATVLRIIFSLEG